MQVKNQKLYSNSAVVGLSQTSSRESGEVKDTQLQSDTVSMMNYLKEKYRNIDFSFFSFENRSQIGQYGATQKGTNHVTISQELLEKMSQDEALRSTVEDVLNHMSDYQKSAQIEALLCDKELVGMGLVIGEDGQVVKWMATQERDKEEVYPTYWRDRESTSFYSKEKKKNRTTPYHYSHGTNMMRLAGARNVPAVRGLIATKYAEMQKVRFQVSDPVEASAVIRKIKAFIQNGNIKIARLHKEENLQLRQKSAEKKMKEKLALQLARELSRKRRARMGQEQCQTAHLDDVLPNSSVNDEQFRQIAEQYASFLSPIDSSTGGTVDTTAGGGSVDVSVMNAPVATVVDCSA